MAADEIDRIVMISSFSKLTDKMPERPPLCAGDWTVERNILATQTLVLVKLVKMNFSNRPTAWIIETRINWKTSHKLVKVILVGLVYIFHHLFMTVNHIINSIIYSIHQNEIIIHIPILIPIPITIDTDIADSVCHIFVIGWN